MSRQCSGLVLSRFFDENVRLIAGMCQRCYEECEEVRIIGVNFVFLKRFGKLHDLDQLHLALKDTVESNEVKVEHGFLESEIELSVKRTNEFNEIVNRCVKEVNKVEERVQIIKAKNSEEGVCRGFTAADLRVSNEDLKSTVRVCNQIRCKLYKKISMRALNNISKRRIIRNTFHENRSKISKRRLKHDRQSKYFSISFDNNNTKTVVVKEEYPKIENIKIECQCQQCKADPNTCDKKYSYVIDPKLEFIDYESLYINSLQGPAVALKNEGSIKIESYSQVKFKDGVIERKPPFVFIPPKSPHNLIEECLYHDPWALLVATIFLNRTSCMCARPCVFWFLAENPDPFSVLDKYPQELEKYFVKLGLQKTRAAQVWRMSHDFVYKKWRNVRELYGIGVYGDDAFRMFCLGDFSVEPKDRFLKIYKAWYQKVAKKGCV